MASTTAPVPPQLVLDIISRPVPLRSADLFSPTTSTAVPKNAATSGDAAATSSSAPSSAVGQHHNYTLPQLRALHRSLQGAAAERGARLRERVGAGYRELLGTASEIVTMRDDADAVVEVLAGLGARCSAGAVARKCSALEGVELGPKLQGVTGAVDATGGETVRVGEDMERTLSREGRARMLAAAEGVVQRLLSGRSGGAMPLVLTAGDGKATLGRGDRLVVAAKVIVLCRLLVKGFEMEEKDSDGARARGRLSPVKLEQARKTLQHLQQRLLHGIQKVLARLPQASSKSEKKSSVGSVNARPTSPRDDILKALTAFALATSSGARDSLRHFLRVRGEAMALALEGDESDGGGQPERVSEESLLRCLSLYTGTLLDVQAITPHRLAEALAASKRRPLLTDETLRGIEALRLDVYERWCGDEVRFYTPFLRHDDLTAGGGPQQSQAREMLATWSKRGGEAVLRGLAAHVERLVDLSAIADLRARAFRHWIRFGAHVRSGMGIDAPGMLDELRQVVQQHMLRVVEVKVTKLRILGSEVESTLQSWREGVTDAQTSLWDVAQADADLARPGAGPGGGSGATYFIQRLSARLAGRTDAVARALACYATWYRVVDEVADVLARLRRQRWDDAATEDDGNDDGYDDYVALVEDEETATARQTLLGQSDPDALAERLEETLTRAFDALDKQLKQLWQKHGGRSDDAEDAGHSRGPVAAYLLRIVRDVRARLPPPVPSVRTTFGLALVPSLHETLAETTVSSVARDLKALADSTASRKTLWEGADPPLPTQPSPAAFVLLRAVSVAMADAGSDLWSAAAVRVLKRKLGERLCEVWTDAVKARLEEAEASVKEGSPVTERKQEGAEDEGKAEESGKTEVAGAETQRKDLFTQWAFDVCVLRLYLIPDASTSEDGYKELEETIVKHTGLGPDERKRLGKAAQEYFKRTSLLFGLLV